MIIGNKRIIEVLNKMLKSGKNFAHAFLFYGPDGVGKRTAAVGFLDGLLCAKRQFGGCAMEASRGNACAPCAEKLQLGYSRDFLKVTPLESGSISIDQIREVSLFLAHKPGIAAMQVVLIDQAESMTEDAVAALLKTLEEPPGDALLILVTDQPGKIAATIHSRLTPIRFSLARETEMEIFPEEIRRIASGRPGFAKRLMEEEDFQKKMKSLFASAEGILNGNTAAKILFAGDLIKDRELLNFCLYRWLQIFRLQFAASDSLARRSAFLNAKSLLNVSLNERNDDSGMRLMLENALINLN